MTVPGLKFLCASRGFLVGRRSPRRPVRKRIRRCVPPFVLLFARRLVVVPHCLPWLHVHHALQGELAWLHMIIKDRVPVLPGLRSSDFQDPGLAERANPSCVVFASHRHEIRSATMRMQRAIEAHRFPVAMVFHGGMLPSLTLRNFGPRTASLHVVHQSLVLYAILPT